MKNFKTYVKRDFSTFTITNKPKELSEEQLKQINKVRDKALAQFMETSMERIYKK